MMFTERLLLFKLFLMSVNACSVLSTHAEGLKLSLYFLNCFY